MARRIVDSEIWEKPAAWLKVWLHIKLKVNWKDKGHIKKGQGFFNWQVEKSALRGVTRHQWEKATIWLRMSGMIATQKASRGIIITVLNYERYQDQDLYNSGTESEGKAEQKRNRSGTIIEGSNSSKSSSNIYNIHNSFKEFWDAYPKKMSKVGAKKAWNRIKPNKDLFDKIMISIKTAKKSQNWIKNDGQFIPHPASWLNDGGWDDVHEVENEPEEERNEKDRLIMNPFTCAMEPVWKVEEDRKKHAVNAED